MLWHACAKITMIILGHFAEFFLTQAGGLREGGRCRWNKKLIRGSLIIVQEFVKFYLPFFMLITSGNFREATKGKWQWAWQECSEDCLSMFRSMLCLKDGRLLLKFCYCCWHLLIMHNLCFECRHSQVSKLQTTLIIWRLDYSIIAATPDIYALFKIP